MRNMKKTAFFLLLAVCGLWACNDNWNDYYDGSSVSGRQQQYWIALS